MAELATLQAQLAAIQKARNSGVLTVTHGDTSTTFRSLSDMDKIIGSLKDQISAAGNTTRRKVRRIYQTGKGL